MREYELVVLLHPDLEIDLDTPVKKLESQIADLGGKVIKRDNWGKKRLAYEIGAHQFAVYVFFVVQIDPDKTDALNRALRLSEEVIRYLLVKSPDIKPAKPGKAKKAKTEAEVEAPAEEEKEAVNG